MTKNYRQCQAITPANSYAGAHRCLKRHGLKKIGQVYLCAHHRSGGVSCVGRGLV